MDHFQYRDGELYAEDVPVSEIASRFGTPCFIYSKATLIRHYHAYADALTDIPHLVCYGMKANSNLAVLQILANEGAGFDIVSRGELERVLKAGGDPSKIVFSGVAKTTEEIQRALEVGIHCFNVESIAELQRIAEIAKAMSKVAPVSLRVNPNVDAQTHPYISTGLKENKFGINIGQAAEVYQHAHNLAGLEVIGVDCHIGSQLTNLSPFTDALQRLLQLVEKLSDIGITLQHLDLGGGLGVSYQDETPPSPIDFAAAIAPLLKNSNLGLILEPGRSI